MLLKPTIHGILDSVLDDKLERKVVKIFQQTDVNTNTEDIEDCHPLCKNLPLFNQDLVRISQF